MIQRSARFTAICLLLVNGFTALYGGWSLMFDPTGTDLRLPPEWIFRLPFTDYFAPGLALFIINGVFSLVAAVSAMMESPGFQRYVIAQGVLLVGWIVVQVVIVQQAVFMHFAMVGIGLTIIGLGLILIINPMNNGYSHGSR